MPQLDGPDIRRAADCTPRRSHLTLRRLIQMLECAAAVTKHQMHVVLRQAWETPFVQGSKTFALRRKWSTTPIAWCAQAGLGDALCAGLQDSCTAPQMAANGARYACTVPGWLRRQDPQAQQSSQCIASIGTHKHMPPAVVAHLESGAVRRATQVRIRAWVALPGRRYIRPMLGPQPSCVSCTCAAFPCTQGQHVMEGQCRVSPIGVRLNSDDKDPKTLTPEDPRR